MMSKSKGFRGVYAHNQIKDQKIDNKVFSSWVMNLDIIASGHTGTHWVCMVCDPLSPVIEYWDSFGVMPDTRTISFLKLSGKKIWYNGFQIQEDRSIRCGYFAVFICRERSKGQTKEQIEREFREHPSNVNEKLVLMA